MWYCRHEIQLRQALFFSAASIAGAFSGLLAFAIAKMDGVGGLEGWRWIFILEGIVTVVVAFGAFFLLHDFPETAGFLTQEEKDFVVHRLRYQGQAEPSGDDSTAQVAQAEEFQWAYVWQAFCDWQIWVNVFVYWGVSIASLPSRDGKGFDTVHRRLSAHSTVLACSYRPSSRTSGTHPALHSSSPSQSTSPRPFWRSLLPGPPIASGDAAPSSLCPFYLWLLASLCESSDPQYHLHTHRNRCIASPNPKVVYGGVFIAACAIYPAFPGNITWLSNNLAGSYKRSAGMAIQIGVGNLGGVSHQFSPSPDKGSRGLGDGFKLLPRGGRPKVHPRARAGVGVHRSWYHRCLYFDSRLRQD